MTFFWGRQITRRHDIDCEQDERLLLFHVENFQPALAYFMLIEPQGTNVSKISFKYNDFHRRIWPWKSRLRNRGYFVLVSMC